MNFDQAIAIDLPDFSDETIYEKIVFINKERYLLPEERSVLLTPYTEYLLKIYKKQCQSQLIVNFVNATLSTLFFDEMKEKITHENYEGSTLTNLSFMLGRYMKIRMLQMIFGYSFALPSEDLSEINIDEQEIRTIMSNLLPGLEIPEEYYENLFTILKITIKKIVDDINLKNYVDENEMNNILNVNSVVGI